MSAGDQIIHRQDLQAAMRVSSETMRRWINSQKLPAPDVAITRRTMGWRKSTLEAAGIKLP